MKVLIEQVEVSPNSVGPPAMNYGQHQRWSPNQKRQYQLVLLKCEFLRKIASCFEDFRQGEMSDVYDDDERSEFPELFRWRELGYPSLQDLVQSKTKLLEQLLVYWEYETSHALSEFSDASKGICYSVNSIDEILFDGDHVIVKGIAYEKIL